MCHRHECIILASKISHGRMRTTEILAYHTKRRIQDPLTVNLFGRALLGRGGCKYQNKRDLVTIEHHLEVISPRNKRKSSQDLKGLEHLSSRAFIVRLVEELLSNPHPRAILHDSNQAFDDHSSRLPLMIARCTKSSSSWLAVCGPWTSIPPSPSE